MFIKDMFQLDVLSKQNAEREYQQTVERVATQLTEILEEERGKVNYTITFTKKQAAFLTRYAEEEGILTECGCPSVKGVVALALERFFGYEWRQLNKDS